MSDEIIEQSATAVDLTEPTFAQSILSHEADQVSGENKSRIRTQESEVSGETKSPRESFEAPAAAAKSDREAFLDALADAQSLTNSNKAEIEKAKAEAAKEALPKEATQDFIDQFLKAYELSPEDLKSPAVRRVFEKQLAEIKAEEGDEAEVDEAEVEEGEAEESAEGVKVAEPQPQPQPPRAPVTVGDLNSIIAEVQDPEVNSPEMVAAIRQELAQVFAAETPEQQANVERLQNVLMVGGHNLVHTLLEREVPRLLEQHISAAIERAMPGLNEAYARQTHHEVWDQVAKEHGIDLKWDSPEFWEAGEKLYAENPYLANLQFRGTPREVMTQRATLCAKLLSGERLTPEKAQKFVDMAKQQANRSQRRVERSRSMGTGKSHGQMGAAKDTSFADSIRGYMQAQKSGERN